MKRCLGQADTLAQNSCTWYKCTVGVPAASHMALRSCYGHTGATATRQFCLQCLIALLDLRGANHLAAMGWLCEWVTGRGHARCATGNSTPPYGMARQVCPAQLAAPTCLTPHHCISFAQPRLPRRMVPAGKLALLHDASACRSAC